MAETSPVWLVTGASRGIGAAVARRAAAGGNRVALVARGASLEAEARELGPEALAIRCDLTDPGAPESAVDATLERFGRLDVLVNNAAVHRGGRIGRLEPSDFDTVLATNLRAPFLLCRAAAGRMEAGAAIVNVGAVVGLRGFAGDTPYASAKAGLAGLTKALAIELGPRGITVNLVVPGFTETDMTASLEPHIRDRLAKMIPLGRPADVDEIASVIAWTAASRYMTGAVVPVDGGLLATFGGG